MVMKKIVFYLLLTSITLAQNAANLADAVKNFDVLKVREYLKNGADPNTLVDGEPAICYIAKFEGVNTIAIFEELIKYDADPNSISKQGNSVLSIAMSIWNARGATELIKRGADLNYKNKGSIPPPLILAVAGKRNWPKSNIYPDLIKFMIENRADINVQDSHGSTPLMSAVYARDLELAKYLLESNADPNIKNINGETPIVPAASMGDIPMVELLLSSGADPNVIPLDKETALMEAAKGGYKEIVIMLIEKGAKTHFKNTWKETAQVLAQQNGHKEIVEILKKAGTKGK
jgi:ankyrin repeat protein